MEENPDTVRTCGLQGNDLPSAETQLFKATGDDVKSSKSTD